MFRYTANWLPRLLIGLAVILGTSAGAVLAGDAPGTRPAEGLVVGLGTSDGRDPATAAEEAARQAQTALRGTSPEVVLLITSWPSAKEDRELPEKNYANAAAIVGGVAKVFPKEKIFGCDSYQALSSAGKGSSRIAILALGGRDLKVKTAAAPCWFWSVAYDKPEASHGLKIQDKWKALLALPNDKKKQRADTLFAAGKTIGQSVGKADKTTSVLLLMGDMHVPAADTVIAGVQEVMGEDFPIIGASCPPDYPCYVAGEAKPAMALGILLSLPMTFAAVRDTGAGTGLNGPDHKLTDEEMRTSGTEPLKRVLAEAQRTSVVFMFDCLSRGSGRSRYLPEVLKLLPPQTVLFGFAGSAECGPEKTGMRSRGAGRCIVYSAIAPAEISAGHRE